jgi:hypothetical protein
MSAQAYRQILNHRLQTNRNGPWDVRTTLAHFALINYALPKDRLRRHIPADRFDIPEFEIDGQRLALLSVAPFLDLDFHFQHFFRFVQFHFGQTNYRVYVVDRATGEHAVWFFGTTLGSRIVQLPRLFWRIPWHYAAYDIDCRYNPALRRYEKFAYNIHSKWAEAEIDLTDTGETVTILPGFESPEQMKLILTHPVDGYFYRLDGRLGNYSVWHEEVSVTAARPNRLYFGLFERLGVLSKEEMRAPHSVVICPRVDFKVFLPPREID